MLLGKTMVLSTILSIYRSSKHIKDYVLVLQMYSFYIVLQWNDILFQNNDTYKFRHAF